MAEASSNIGTVAVNVMPVLDEDALTEMVDVIAHRVKIAINRAIRESVQVAVTERLSQ